MALVKAQNPCVRCAFGNVSLSLTHSNNFSTLSFLVVVTLLISSSVRQCWKNWQHFDIYLKFQSFQSKRSLISGVSFSTRTIQRSQKVKTQKVNVAEFCNCSHSHSDTHATIAVKKLTGSSSSCPLLFSSLCPKSLLTEAKKAPSPGGLCFCK